LNSSGDFSYCSVTYKNAKAVNVFEPNQPDGEADQISALSIDSPLMGDLAIGGQVDMVSPLH
jgi:hypothetical protein